MAQWKRINKRVPPDIARELRRIEPWILPLNEKWLAPGLRLRSPGLLYTISAPPGPLFLGLIGSSLLIPYGLTEWSGLPETLPPALLARIRHRRYLTLMGRRRDIEAAADLLPAVHRISVDYELKQKKGTQRLQEDPIPELAIRPASPRDTDLVFPLHRAYELEEVVLNPRAYREEPARERLRTGLKRYPALLGFSGKNLAARVAVNGIGTETWQVGGVFTLPEYRRRGIAAAMMNALSAKAGEEGKTLSLFVKKSNAPALRLYNSCHFETMGDYRITYLKLS